MALELSSPAFQNGQPIPNRYTCKGENISPALEWRNVPGGTQSLVLILEDPDNPGRQGVLSHWVLFNIPPERDGLEENLKAKQQNIGVLRNGFANLKYDGPCVAPGQSHRYVFHLYALDRKLDLQTGGAREKLQEAIDRHMLGHAELMGTFSG